METVESARHDVEAMLGVGAGFEHIEAYIEGRKDLTPDVKSALWLLAWCETDEHHRRDVVDDLLAGLA
jgi:hypothetical protein